MNDSSALVERLKGVFVREPLLELDQATASLAREAVTGWSLHPAALEA